MPAVAEPLPERCATPGLEVWFEREPDYGKLVAHVRLLDGHVFGKAEWLRRHLPRGCWMSIPPDQQPAVTWYLRRHVGFVLVDSGVLVDGEPCDILWRPNIWGGGYSRG